jgi:protein O-mannosyl-transferase
MRPSLHTALAALLIAAAACCAWSNSFSGPFVFDDGASIAYNATILQLWPPEWLHPPGSFGETVGGRPLLNLSFALNHALSGLDVRGIHATNLAIHVLAALTLFGLVRRALRLPRLAQTVRGRATVLAGTIAALWALHPLQTAAVTYMVQRAESLAALFVLLALYAYLRSAEPGARRAGTWAVVSACACLLGAATKETAATAPLLALLLDRTLIAGSFREAWRARGRLLLALASSWLLIAALGTGGRGGTVGFASKMESWPYLLTQASAIVRYLSLAFWPSPLVFDYGASTVRGLGAVLPQSLLVVLLLAATGLALARRWPAGLLGAWFFLALAPTSSIIPVATQTIAEHRMYLPLAAVIAGSVLALYQLVGRAALVPLLLCAAALGVGTWQRNLDYRTEHALWADTIAKHPENARVYANAGRVFLIDGDPASALAFFRHALELDPHLVTAKVNLGNALRETGQVQAAEATLREVVADEPGDPTARLALGTVLVDLGRPREAAEEYRAAMRLAPETVSVRTNLAAVLIDLGDVREALELLRAAAARNPRVAEVHFHLGRALLASGDAAGGIERLREAARLKPALPVVHFTLGDALAARGDFSAAVDAYRGELALDPRDVPARNNLATALVRAGRLAEAIREFETVLEADPGNASVRHNLEYVRALPRDAAPR